MSEHILRKISYKLNDWGVKTPRGKKWFNTSVSSVLKRKHERDDLVNNIRNKHYPSKISKMDLTDKGVKQMVRI